MLNAECRILQVAHRFPEVAGEKPRDAFRAVAGHVQEGVRQRWYHLQGGARRGALLWVDRRGAKVAERRGVRAALYATESQELLECGEHAPCEGTNQGKAN